MGRFHKFNIKQKNKMPYRDAIRDTITTIMINGGILGLTTLSDLHEVLKILLIILTIGLTIRQWIKLEKRK